MIRFFSHLFPKAVTVHMLEDIKLILHFDCSLNLSYSAVCKYIFHNVIISGIFYGGNKKLFL